MEAAAATEIVIIDKIGLAPGAVSTRSDEITESRRRDKRAPVHCSHRNRTGPAKLRVLIARSSTRVSLDVSI
jgi:hypothetical protein